MIIVPLNKPGKLERLTMRNWCTEQIGKEDPELWFEFEPTQTGLMSDASKYSRFLSKGMLSCIIFFNDADATAFKLRFGL